MSFPQPGLRNQRGVRLALRIGGGLLVGLGAVLAVTGVLDFASEWDSSVDSGPGSLLRAGGGGMLVVLGLALIGFGTLGAQARYAAGETMPVVKDSASYLSDGRGIMGVGATGPFCRACGARNDDEARFCDGCGKALA